MPKYAIQNMQEISKIVQKCAEGYMYKYAKICNGQNASNMQVYAEICRRMYAIICKYMHIH